MSWRGLGAAAHGLNSMLGCRLGDQLVSYLPLCHMAEQMFSIHIPMSVGATVNFAEILRTVQEDLRELSPHVFFGVPRIWEKFHAGVTAKLAQATGVKAKLMAWTRRVCREVTELRNHGKEPGGALALQYKLADRLVLSKLKPALGLGRARLCVTGAAPLATDVIEFFASLDIVLYEIYGQSEDCGPTSFNLPGAARFGTVGRPLAGVEEIVARGGVGHRRGAAGCGAATESPARRHTTPHQARTPTPARPSLSRPGSLRPHPALRPTGPRPGTLPPWPQNRRT